MRRALDSLCAAMLDSDEWPHSGRPVFIISNPPRSTMSGSQGLPASRGTISIKSLFGHRMPSLPFANKALKGQPDMLYRPAKATDRLIGVNSVDAHCDIPCKTHEPTAAMKATGSVQVISGYGPMLDRHTSESAPLYANPLLAKIGRSGSP